MDMVRSHGYKYDIDSSFLVVCPAETERALGNSHASGHVLRWRAFTHRIPTVPKISVRNNLIFTTFVNTVKQFRGWFPLYSSW